MSAISNPNIDEIITITDVNDIPALTDADHAAQNALLSSNDLDTVRRRIKKVRLIGQPVIVEGAYTGRQILQARLVLSVSHDKARKQLNALLSRNVLVRNINEEAGEPERFGFSTSSLFEDTQCLGERQIARYSKQQLMDFAGAYIDILDNADEIDWGHQALKRVAADKLK